MPISYIELQDLMIEALSSFNWDDYGHDEKFLRNPDNLLSSRVYWAWLCA